MHNSAVKRGWIVVAGVALVALLAVVPAYAVAGAPTPLQVTNTTGGQNQNSSIDASGNDIVFTSNSNDAGQSTFDQQALGNGFTPPGASHPNPICVNCNNTDTNGELYLWHKKATKNAPANSFFQITTSTGGGLAANEFPDINQKGTFVVWDSDRDLVGNNAEAD